MGERNFQNVGALGKLGQPGKVSKRLLSQHARGHSAGRLSSTEPSPWRGRRSLRQVTPKTTGLCLEAQITWKLLWSSVPSQQGCHIGRLQASIVDPDPFIKSLHC